MSSGGHEADRPTTRGELDRATLARVYNGANGGALNFAVDRELLAQVTQLVPGYQQFAAANRAFVHTAILRFHDDGITQVLDLGSGMFSESTHDIAHRINPATRVVYVDTDPVVIAQLELATTEDNDQVGVLHADICRVDAVMQAAVVQRVLDVSRPVGLLAAAVLHCVPDDDTFADVATVMSRYHDVLAPGSMLALSHASGDKLPADLVTQAIDLFAQSDITIVSRTQDEIRDLLNPWEPELPGLARLHWQLGSEVADAHGYAAIAKSIRDEVQW
jgi:hypothetical protein